MRDDDAIRAFFGLEFDASARHCAAALLEALRAEFGDDDVRWVREESLHVTLRFLGSTDPSRVPDLVDAVARETRHVAPFALGLGVGDVFPARRPRVVALDLEPAAPLLALAAAVERGVVAAGFPPEDRAFRPHATLGRVRRGRRLRLDSRKLRDVTGSVTERSHAWDVMETVLFRSDLSPTGAQYTPLARVPLGTPGGTLHP